MSNPDPRPVLITGGTGMQGLPTVTATLAKGIAVRALVRDPSSPAAQALAARGVDLAQGSFEDAASLDRAVAGVRGVFSLQLANPMSGGAQQQALVDAAKKAGVEHFIQSSVSSTGLHEGFVDWDAGRWDKWYWLDKHHQEEAVRHAGFRYWTMVRPAMLMDNLLVPRAKMMHPDLVKDGQIVTVTELDVPVAYVSAETVGEAAAVAFADPQRFHGVNMELADELISHQAIADIVSEVTGKPVTAVKVSYDEQIARGLFEGMVRAQDWLTHEGYAARPAMLADYGITPLPLREWARRHVAKFEIGSPT